MAGGDRTLDADPASVGPDARARVERLCRYPVKGLDGAEVDAVGLAPGGTLAGDREYALVGPDGSPVNGKRTDRVHRLRTAYDPETTTLTVRRVGAAGGGPGEPRRFDLAGDPGAAEAWFSDYFELPVSLRRDREGGFPDRPDAGPSVVSTATLEAVSGWFDGLTVDAVRRRLRANVEVDGVPAFWEDRFVGPAAPTFEVGPAPGPEDGADDGVTGGTVSSRRPVRFEGVEPCGRCVVPTRDPDTGEPTPGFRERFVERRAATFPDWADRDAFPHDYTLMLIARVPEADRSGSLRVGDPVRVVEAGGRAGRER